MQTLETTSNTPICLKTELRKEFVRRCKSNAAYSMRAYAKFLGVDQSLLSKILNGQRTLSRSLVEKIAAKLKMKPSAIAHIIQSRHAIVPIEYNQLADDEVSLLAEWSHFAILELVKTKDFKFDTKWMANRLGLRPTEIEDSVERLLRMKFIKVDDGQLSLLKPNNNWTNTTATTVAKQELQRSLLKKAEQAVESIPFDVRENMSLTVAVRSDRMPEFKEKLRQIRDELDAYFQPAEDEPKFDEVYQLTVSLFPLTQNKFKKDL